MRLVVPSFLLLLVTSSPALAVFCARDVVPAATLLVPYVEVDMDGDVPDRDGRTTILRVTNTAAEPALVQLVVWTAAGELAIDFPVALSGYDVWTMDFADLLAGTWSRFDTSLSGAAPPNRESEMLKRTPFESGPDGRSVHWGKAPYSRPWARGLAAPGKTSDLSQTSDCKMPYTDSLGAIYAPDVVRALQDPLFARDHLGCGSHLRVRHAGDWLRSLTANHLFFYASVHVVRSCDLATITDPGYAENVALDRDVLLGEVEYLDPAHGTLELTPAVHLEVAVSTAQLATVGPFEAQYGHEDRREPLGTAFAFHYESQAPLTASSLMLWKPFHELGDGQTWGADVRDCGVYMYYAWDQDEHVFTRGCMCDPAPCECIDLDPNEFPLVTQLVPLTNAGFDLPSQSGWMLLVLPPSYVGFTEDPTPGTVEPNPRYQGVAAVRTVLTKDGKIGAGWTEAATLGSAQCQMVGGAR